MTDVQPNTNIAQHLPFDILQEIFELCLRYNDDPEFILQPRSALAPLVLCRICVSWRTAALGMPSIWKSTTFALNTIRHPDSPYDRRVLPKTKKFVAWWMEHLSNVAPSLYLPSTSTRSRHRSIYVDKLENANTTLFDGPFFRSAQRLRLSITNQELDLICSNPAPFPNLVELRMENFPDSRIPRIAASPFPISPLLTHLQLSHAESFVERPLSIFPWSQLTHLYLPRTMSADSWRILSQRCTNLRIMAVILSDANPDTSSQPIVIDTLRQLVIAFNHMHPTVPFGLVFPQLTAFRLITRLTSTRFLTIEALEGILSSMPALVELHFDWVFSFTDQGFIPFDQLDLRNGRCLSSYLPHLKYLVIDFIDPSTCNVGKNIIRFLQSDWLRSGWPSLDSSGSRIRRSLDFIVQNSSYFEDQPIPDEIVDEVASFLRGSQWPADAPFVVSIRDEEMAGGSERDILHVFDEQLPIKGWNKAVGFYTSAD